MPVTSAPARSCLRAVLTAVVLCSASAAIADLIVPDEQPPAAPAQRSAPLPLTVEEDAATPVHRIVIPKAVLAKLAGDVPDASTIASASHGRSSVAALALSAAVACGLVASRCGRPGRLAAGVIVGLVAAGAARLIPGIPARADRAAANVPPPRVGRPVAPVPDAARPDSVVVAQGAKVVLEIAPEGAEAIVLVVGKAAGK
ncbi:MAG: hypothetical protein ACK6CT_13285 [Planctomycetia bacterium]